MGIPQAIYLLDYMFRLYKASLSSMDVHSTCSVRPGFGSYPTAQHYMIKCILFKFLGMYFSTDSICRLLTRRVFKSDVCLGSCRWSFFSAVVAIVASPLAAIEKSIN